MGHAFGLGERYAEDVEVLDSNFPEGNLKIPRV